MFGLCEQMNWAHLPVAGGLNDQDPDLLDRWRIIFSAKSEHEAEERRKQERNRGGNTSGGKLAGHRRRA